MKNLKKSDLIFYAILLAYAAYAAIYIYKTSFVMQGERFFVLFDDAMISMRYAKNLAHGAGLVWNPGGAHIEGYTNPLWVVFMSLFHLFPIPASKISLLVQVSGALFLIASLFFIKKIAELLSGSSLVALLAVILTAFYMPLNNWVLQGMEVSVLTLIISAAVWMALNSWHSKRFSPWLYVLLGIGTLVRIDMAVPYLVIMAFMVITSREHRRQNLAWGLGLFAVFILSQTVFRVLYYGDPLPNTYYLKMTGYSMVVRIARGLYVFLQFVQEFNWVLFLLPLSILIFRRDRDVFLLFLLFAGQVAYSIYVGGDAWEQKGGANRYFAIVMPLYFILFVYAVDLIRKALVNLVQPSRTWVGPLSNLVLVFFVLAGMVNFNFIGADVKSLQRWVLRREPLFIEGNKEDVQIALDLKQITSPQATVAVVAAGAIPYFSDRFAIDLLGKSDVKIAHEKSKVGVGLGNLGDLRPGHNKWDYAYSIGQLKPDVVTQLWGDAEEAKRLYIAPYYTGGGAGDNLFFSLLTGSPNILWENIKPMP
jgi:arabinofuranosyltransferase